MNLPREIILIIAAFLDLRSIIRFGLTCRTMNQLLREPTFWLEKMYQDFGPNAVTWLKIITQEVPRFPHLQYKALYQDELEMNPQVVAGTRYGLATRADGTVWFWKRVAHKEMFKTEDELIPKQIEGFSVKAMAEGEGTFLILTKGGRVWSWGNNEYGQLGIGNTIDQKNPVCIDGLDGIKAVALSGWHCLALKDDGTVWAWGRNCSGQVGREPNEFICIPVRVPHLLPMKRIEAGGLHSLSLANDGTIWAWGNIRHAQLGNMTCLPQQIPNFTNIQRIAAGWLHSLALTKDGTLWAWGSDRVRQLGNRQTGWQYVPTRVLIPPVKTMSVGVDYNLALANDGSLWTWGSDTAFQPRFDIPKMTEIRGITQLAHGPLALTNDSILDLSRPWASQSRF